MIVYNDGKTSGAGKKDLSEFAPALEVLVFLKDCVYHLSEHEYPKLECTTIKI